MGISGATRFFLRDLTGHEELASFELSAEGATQLILRLVTQKGQEGETWWRRHLSSQDRDHLIVQLYQRCFGDQVQSRVGCPSCEREVELAFSLQDYVDSLLQGRVPAEDETWDQESACWTTTRGARFRLPHLLDELQLRQEGPTSDHLSLARLCVMEQGGESLEEIEARILRLSPWIAGELSAQCAHCSATCPVTFDVCEFFLAALAGEQPLLLREVHCLARVYGWSLREILDLSREHRRQLVALVLAESEPGVQEVA